MAFDSLSPVAPTRVRCLLVPRGPITQADFLRFKQMLELESIIRLGDVSPSDGLGNNLFSPQAFPSGSVFYNICVAEPSPVQLALAPMELYRMPLVILGIASGATHTETVSGSMDVDNRNAEDAPVKHFDELSKQVAWLRDQYPSSLVYRVFIFDSPETHAAAPKDLIFIPTVDQMKASTMKTVMCDLTSSLLQEMTSFAKHIQAQTSIETPSHHEGDPIDGRGRPASQGHERPRPLSRLSDGPSSRSASPGPDSDRSAHRASFPPRLKSPLPPSPKPEADSAAPSRESSRGPPVTFEEMRSPSERPLSTSNAELPRLPSRGPHQAQPLASNSIAERARSKAKGRIGVILGSMFLLAGRWPEAVRELTDSALLARGSNDHVWHAKALDYILVCMLLYGWAGMDFTIPSVCNPLADKENLSKKSGKAGTADAPDLGALRSPPAVSRSVALQQLCGLLPDLVNNILHLYIRAATFTVDKIPQLSFSESAVRFCKLQAYIDASRGVLNDHCLQAIVLDLHLSPAVTESPSYEHFSTRADIAATLFRAIPSPGMERSIDLPNLLKLYAAAASVLSILGYQRKRAFLLRDMTTQLLPAVIQSRKDNAARIGIHPAASLSSNDIAHQGAAAGQTMERPNISSPGVEVALNAMTETYAVMLAEGMSQAPAVSLQTHDTSSLARPALNPSSEVVHRIVRNAQKHAFGSPRLKFDVLRICLQISEALPDPFRIVHYISTLLLTASEGIAMGPGAQSLSPLMPFDDQTRMVTMMKRTANAFRMTEHLVQGTYWDDFLVRDIQVSNLGVMDLPTIRRRSELEQSRTIQAPAKGGPFIYNPFHAKVPSNNELPTLVQGERRTFTVLLQNLYDIDIEFEWIRLETSNSAIEAETRNVVIGPSRFQRVQLHATPKTIGQHAINGCFAKVFGCRARYFPLFTDPWRSRDPIRFKRADVDAQEPLASQQAGTGSPRTSIADFPPNSLDPNPTSLRVQVIPDQPRLMLEYHAAFRSTTALLEGETKLLSVSLQNPSSTVIDYIRISSSDSISTSLRAAIDSKELSPAQIFELEFAIHHHETLRRRAKSGDQDTVPANDSLNIEFEIYGKIGLTNGMLAIEYGHVGRPESSSDDAFFTRALTAPLSFTVSPSVRLVRNDLLPLTGNFAWLNRSRHQTQPIGTSLRGTSSGVSGLDSEIKTEFQRLFRRLGLGSDGKDHAVLLLDFINAWSRPLSISLQVRSSISLDSTSEEPWERAYTVHKTIQPGALCRILVLVPKIRIENPFQAIPSLNAQTKRQFVVSGERVPPEVERLNREMFWYKDKILKCLRATWRDTSGQRNGDISLRSLQLTEKMMQAIKLEDVKIEVDVRHQAGGNDGDSGATRPNIDEPLVLTTKISNRSLRPLRLLLRVQPSLRHQPYTVALDLAKKIAFNGLLQRPIQLLKPGESIKVLLGLSFLSAGEYEVGASAEEIRPLQPQLETGAREGARQRANTGDLAPPDFGEKERRVWYAKDPCVITVQSSSDDLGK